MNYFRTFKCIVILFAGWTILTAAVFCWFLGFLDTNYMRFGPSNDLVIIGIGTKIETWGKWLFVCSYSFLDSFFSYFVFDTIYPWINGSILNVDKLEIHNPKGQTWVLINVLYGVNALRMVFSAGLIFTQIDIFLIGQLGTLASGFLTTGYAILLKTRAILPEKSSEIGPQGVKLQNDDDNKDDFPV